LTTLPETMSAVNCLAFAHKAVSSQGNLLQQALS